MVRHNYKTCDRCEALDSNTKGDFREVTGSSRLDLCAPCWDLFELWLAKAEPGSKSTTGSRAKPDPTQSATSRSAGAAADPR
jgi:hypothetical protein